jgi:hypothetical protein
MLLCNGHEQIPDAYLVIKASGLHGITVRSQTLDAMPDCMTRYKFELSLQSGYLTDDVSP